MKKRWIIFVVMISLLVVNVSVYSVSPSHYLRSRLINLAAKLYQEISATVQSNSKFYYKIGFLPMIDVNGDNPDLVRYLEDKMVEVISRYPALRVVSSEEVLTVWNDLKSQELTDQEMFRLLGERLELSGVIMTSLITHPQHYSINGMVVDAQAGNHNDVELIILERDIIDVIPIGSGQQIKIPTIPSEKPKQEEPEVSESTEPKEEPEPIQVEPIKPEFIDESSTGLPKGEVEYSMALQDQSPRFSNLLFGFDFGDFNGDGKLEVGYSAGNTFHVRDLDDYGLLWSLNNYSTLSNDHKVLAVDLDGDSKDELISHGNLLEVQEDQLIKGQPRFNSRPVCLYDSHGVKGVALYNGDTIYVVNYQGLVLKRYKLGQDMGKRFVFASLEGNDGENLITTMTGLNDSATIKIFQAIQSLTDLQTLPASYGFAIHAADLDQNGKPEIYLRRNYFSQDQFLYSKIYVLESKEGELQLIGESPKLDYFIVDFTSYPKKNPTHLVVGGMYLTDKKQSIQEIQSRLFYYNLEQVR